MPKAKTVERAICVTFWRSSAAPFVTPEDHLLGRTPGERDLHDVDEPHQIGHEGMAALV